MKKEKVPEIHKEIKKMVWNLVSMNIQKLMNIVKKLVFSGLLLPGTWKV